MNFSDFPTYTLAEIEAAAKKKRCTLRNHPREDRYLVETSHPFLCASVVPSHIKGRWVMFIPRTITPLTLAEI